ncbi:MAG: WecB/TagA/CpsF family glycosyltransferase [Sedimentisphaerales bacterium]|jgi:N-acetylglucosaminyldiphosphoundecaprenol N-acetyl-beta-D-mannosaminyltransferase|nr:WecB/TagA/CpsF family glycosyltransferase [Sedimentisphaerales bacterium]HOC61596.1 WecB/TagA/CpsF family glycosyltransferase [Sedimentisphaerales bacterium]HOH62428.1 WecB/TagA/CpsF family glycosyltransferase [Sedimentisphaerales bacterium]HQA91830.1 WecB/TagA/CpsF family glycosyltransferase [Sedimentisphaerales bacterium]HQN31867.1 WecB/TagA/CpsF family glycosyltransferase [Sedimentisphaerales bacterium]
MLHTIRNREKTYCVAINPEKVCLAREDAGFEEIVKKATFHICDGAGTAAAVRILWGLKIPRVTGVDLFLRMLQLAEEEDLGVFLFGACPETIRRAREKLREKHPRLRCVGYRDGYFDDRDCESIVEQINASKADMLFIALGSPKQERWIARHRAQLLVPFCMGVGGSFDVLSGHVKRAPWVFRRTGTEWLYRLARQPSRWRRQIALLRFAASVLKQRARPQVLPENAGSDRTPGGLLGPAVPVLGETRHMDRPT